jgi:hypothetical protein
MKMYLQLIPDCAIAVTMIKEEKLCDLNWIERAVHRIKREVILLKSERKDLTP